MSKKVILSKATKITLSFFTDLSTFSKHLSLLNGCFLRMQGGLFMSKIKFSTNILPLKVTKKSTETKHDICSKLIIKKLERTRLTSL